MLIHGVVFAVSAWWLPNRFDYSKLERDGIDHSIGNEYVDFRLSSAIRQTNWSLTGEIIDSNSDVISTIDYDLSKSVMKEHSLVFNFLGTDILIQYAKNEARDKEGIGYDAGESISGLLGFDDFFDNGGRLIARYKKDKTQGDAIINKDTKDAQVHENIKLNHEEFMLAEEFSGGAYLGYTYSIFNNPMEVPNYDSIGNKSFYFDRKAKVKSSKIVMGENTANVKLKQQRSYSGLYLNHETGIGLYTLDFSKGFNGGKNLIGDGAGWIYSGYYELGYSFHRRYESLYDSGFSMQLGYSVELDMYEGGVFADNVGDRDTRIERFDIKHGPVFRLTAVF
jgi:hypothetical protein